LSETSYSLSWKTVQRLLPATRGTPDLRSDFFINAGRAPAARPPLARPTAAAPRRPA